jgi:hypothetical protein
MRALANFESGELPKAEVLKYGYPRILDYVNNC